MTFVEWFPLAISFDTLLMYIVTLFLVMAGTLVGITIKELEVFNPNSNPTIYKLFSNENKLFLLLGMGVSVGFWIANIPAVECFTYSTVLKAGLGTLRNVIDKRRNGK